MNRNKRIRFMDNQLMTVNNITSSSIVDSSFPLANMLKDGRHKATRFTGSFDIDGTNDEIHIDDGALKTGNVTNGTYSGADLATAITTALNAVSSNWTVTYNTITKLFTISRSAGTDTLKLSTTTNAIWDTIGFIGVVDQAAAVGDVVRNHTSEYLVIDLGNNANEVGFFGIQGISGIPFPMSESGTIRLRASNMEATLKTAPVVDVTIAYSDIGLYKFLDDLADTNLRFWRVDLIDRTSNDNPPWDITNIYLGTYTTFLTRGIQRGFTKNWVDPSTIFRAESGAVYANKRTAFLELEQLSMVFLNKADRQAIEQIGIDFGLHTPLWVSLDPLGEVSDLDELTRYVHFREIPKPVHFRDSRYSLSFAFRDAL